MTIDFSAAPYNDDFSEDKKYYKVLFKPGLAVQTRELNQVQSIITEQINTFGRHIFKEGSMVIPGNSSIDTNAPYVKLAGTTVATSLIGKTLVGSDSGISALVVFGVNSEQGQPPTLYVKYLNSGSDNLEKTFRDSEQLLENSLPVASTFDVDSTGVGSIASIEEGFYFIKKHFVQVSAQTIVLDKYSNTPSYKIGLDAIEDFISSDDDETLLDNAQGTPNFAAPGADRYQIDLRLVKKNLDDTSIETNFIQLIVVANGKVQQKISNSDYSILEANLARRTYDESGDYTVRNFPIDVREYRDNFRGLWSANTNYLAGDVVLHNGNYYVARKDGTSNLVAPTQTVGSSTIASTGVVWTYEKSPFFNRGIHQALPTESLATQNENKEKLAIGLEPGKAYVRGYEIEKVGTSYIDVTKSRTTLQQTNLKTVATVGNYIIATNLHSLPNTSTFPTVSLYNQFTGTPGTPAGTLVGTARVRFVEFNGDTPQGLTSTKYKVSLFDIKMNDGYSFNRDVKMLYLLNGGTATSFTAEIFPATKLLTGSVTSATNTVSGTGTVFTEELKVGDYIIISGNRRRVVAIADNTSLTIDTNLSQASSTIFSREETVILETENDALIYPMPYPYIKSVRDAEGDNVTSYTAKSRFLQNSVSLGATGSITVSVTGNDTFASPADNRNYIIVDNTTGSVVVPNSIVYGVSQQQIVITVPSGVVKEYIVCAAINKSGASTEKSKTLNTQTITVTTRNSATAPSVKLGKADGFRLLEVKMDTGTFLAPTGIYSIDITDRYTFNDGQKATHYDIASIDLLAGNVAPNAPIQITFEYFTHSGSGDHFTVNSYLSTMSYDEIPSYAGIPLAYMFDFRPRMADDGINFVGTTLIPKRGIDIESDFQHYLGRIDKIALNKDGEFFTIQGTSDIIPSEPSEASTGMVLYKLEYQPYTFSTNSVAIQSVDNKRYTMRDIGKIEKRVDNIEYYTALSMLEQEAQSLEIQDEFGLNRFKNGFIVDAFTSHGIGDVNSQDYKCAIDMENAELRPQYHMDNVNIVEENINDIQRANNHYQVTGDLITLPYEEVELVKQLDASTVENINPFAIFSFIGSTELNPPMDEWFETNRLPDIVTNVEGNFDVISTIAERTGVLSPVWNAWQTQWTGTPVSSGVKKYTTGNGWASNRGDIKLSKSEFNATFGTSGSGPARQIVAEVSSAQVGQSRTGIRNVVVQRIDREVTADRVLSKAIIPYIRARSLLFTVQGLKPNTVFTPFFDSVNVQAFTTQSTQINITSNDIFSSTVRAGGDSSESARLVNGNAQSALDRGDVVFVKQRGTIVYTKETSPATGVLTLVSKILNTTDSTLHIVNVKGSFLNGDIVEGSITGATSTITANPVVNALGEALVSNANGDVVGIFDIPNTESNRFRTGVREFKLSDDPTDSPDRTSFARKQYRAEGIIETKQASVTATRNADIRQEAITENRTIVQTSARIISDTGWYDPLAQTFLVDSVGGAFATSVDIFFATKDNVLPVRLQIREVVNGYPGKVILPFSEVTVPADKVLLASTTVETTKGDVYPAPTVATNFKFPSPVYLNDKTEYCIVLVSDSNNYRCWISQLGETSVVKGNIISEQPYAGVLFKSQNASTWTADQYQDLMFRINKAKFDIVQIGQVDFVNDIIPNYLLQPNPFNVVAGTNYIRVSHENHGFFAGAKVTISGAVGVDSIPDNEINATHTIVSVENDSYIIQVTTNAVSSGSFGEGAVYATENIQYTTIQPIVQQQVFSETSATHSIRTVSGKSVDGAETPYIVSNYNSVAVNENNRLAAVQLIGNKDTEAEFIGSEKSLKLRSRISSTNENISPVIDIARLSAIVIQDRLNKPTEATMNFPALDTRNVVTANNLIAVEGTNKFTTTDATTKLAFQTIGIGKYIVTSGFASASNNGKFKVIDKNLDGSFIQVEATLVNVAAGASVTINALDRYSDEIAPVGGSSVAKYISKKITLANSSTFLKVRFSADVEQLASIDMYYKLQATGSDIDFNSIHFNKATPIREAVPSDDGKFVDVEYELSNLVSYDAVQIKLVMNSPYSADIVRVKDLVIIAAA